MSYQMGETMGIGEYIVIGISIAIAAWFLIGSYINNQKSQQILSWLVKGASALGKVSAARFLAPSRSGVRAMIKFEDGPVAQVEVVMALVRRENLPLWLFQLITRRKDLLTLNFSSRKTPAGEMWAFPSKSAAGLVEQANQGQKAPLVFREEQGQHRLYTRQKEDEQAFNYLRGYLNSNPAVQVIVLQAKSPNLILIEPIKSVMRSSSEAFFRQVEKLLD